MNINNKYSIIDIMFSINLRALVNNLILAQKLQAVLACNGLLDAKVRSMYADVSIVILRPI